MRALHRFAAGLVFRLAGSPGPRRSVQKRGQAGSHGVIEPPWVWANFLSSFEKAEIKEILVMRHSAERLKIVTCQTVTKEEPASRGKTLPPGWEGAGGLGFRGAFAVLPTVRYLRIFSRRFGPRPRIASKSSTFLKAPCDLRICKILSAVAGPMPGSCCNSSDVAVLVLMFTGIAGGFFI